MKEIIFYRTALGACPVETFLDSLSGKQAQKVFWVLRLIQELEPVPSQYLKKLVNTDDIWEVRIQVGNDIFRLLGFFFQTKFSYLNEWICQKDAKDTPSRN